MSRFDLRLTIVLGLLSISMQLMFSTGMSNYKVAECEYELGHARDTFQYQG